jgi:hypothetical protein
MEGIVSPNFFASDNPDNPQLLIDWDRRTGGVRRRTGERGCRAGIGNKVVRLSPDRKTPNCFSASRFYR